MTERTLNIFIRASQIHVTGHNNPWSLQTIEHVGPTGVIHRREHPSIKWKSPLTRTELSATPKVEDQNDVAQVTGYFLSLNASSAMVSSPVLQDNQVTLFSDFALKSLQCQLLDNHCPPELVEKLTLEHAALSDTKLTYWVPVPHGKSPQEMVEEMAQRATSLSQSPHIRRENRLASVKVSTGPGHTVSIGLSREMEVHASAVVGPTQPDSCEIAHTVQAELFTESARYMRLDVRLKSAWFQANPSYASPLSWSNVKVARAIQAEVFDSVRQLLAVGECFRKSVPKAQDKKSLAPAEQAVLEFHLAGKPARAHTNLLGKSPQYVHSVKKAIREKLHIDVDIPWVVQQGMPALDWLVYPGRYKLPEALMHLGKFVFTRETAKKALAMMDGEIEKRRNGLVMTIPSTLAPTSPTTQPVQMQPAQMNVAKAKKLNLAHASDKKSRSVNRKSGFEGIRPFKHS